MPIVRAPRPQSNFYLLDKQISEDKRLSWAARGLLVFLLGKPDHWRVSVQALVNETADASMSSGRDAVYRILKELQQAGYIARAQSKNQGGTFAEVDYMVSEQPLEPLTENPDAAPLPPLPDTAQPHTANPTLVSTDKAVRIEKAASTEDSPGASSPPAEKSKRQKRTPLSLQAWLDELKAIGEEAVPAVDPIFAWAEKTNVPREMLWIAWKVFKERFVEAPEKKQADWRAHYRNAVKGNWFHIWFFDACGICCLTTAGEQARRAHEVDAPFVSDRMASGNFRNDRSAAAAAIFPSRQEMLEMRNREVARRLAGESRQEALERRNHAVAEKWANSRAAHDSNPDSSAAENQKTCP